MKLALLLPLFLPLACTLLSAQDAVIQTDLIGLAADAQHAIDAGDWQKAATLTSALKEATREARNRAWAAATRDLEDRVLASLPEDTETVAAWHEPFALEGEIDIRRAEGPAAARNYLNGLLNIAANGRVAQALSGRMVRLSLVAARHFEGHPLRANDPPPLGMIDYQGCAVYWFSEALPAAIPDVDATETVESQPVWAFRASQHEALRDGVSEWVLLARPQPDLLLACNDRDFLTSVLTHLDSRRRMGRFRPQAMPAWKYLDRSTPFWAFRRFAPERAPVDPTQPANPSVLGRADPEAVALAVNMDGAGTLKALWISRSDDDPWRVTLNAGAFERKAQSRFVAPGLWELSVPADRRISAPAVFALMSCLGFAVRL